MAKKKSSQVSEALTLIKMCDDALLRKIGMENVKIPQMAMEELVRREQKNISKQRMEDLLAGETPTRPE